MPREQVQDRDRLELVPRHELAAHHARTGNQQIGRIREDLLERHVAAESTTDGSHLRVAEIVPGAVDGAAAADRGIGLGRVLLNHRRLFGVVQVLRAEIVTDFYQIAHRKEAGLLVPLPSLESLGNPGDQIIRHARSPA